MSNANYLLIYLTAIVFLFSNLIFGQSFETIKRYNTYDGLPSDLIYTVIQDKENHYWIATDNGVSKFNGSFFKNYSVANGLPSNDIFEIKIDTKDRKWLTGYYSGLYFIQNDKIFKVKNANKYMGVEFAFEKGDTVFFKIPYHKNLFYLNNNYTLKEYSAPKNVEILDFCLSKNMFIGYDNLSKRNVFLDSNNKIVHYFDKEFYYNPLISDSGSKLFFLKNYNTKSVSLIERNFTNETYLFLNDRMKKTNLYNNNYKVLNKNGLSKYKIIFQNNLIKVFEKGIYNYNLSNKLNLSGYNFKEVHHVFIDKFNNFWIINNDNTLTYIPHYFDKIKSFKLNYNNTSKSLLGTKINEFIYFISSDNFVYKYDIYNKTTTKLNINFDSKIHNILQHNNFLFFVHKKGFFKYDVQNNSELRFVESLNPGLQRNSFLFNNNFLYLNRCTIYNQEGKILFDNPNQNLRYNRLFVDNYNYLISNENELLLIEKKNKKVIKNNFVKNTNIIETFNDSYLIGTNNGLYCLNKSLNKLDLILKGHNIYALKIHDKSILVGSNKGFFVVGLHKNKLLINKFINDANLFLGNRIIKIESDKQKYYLLMQDKIIQIEKNISFNFSKNKLELDFIKSKDEVFFNTDNLVLERNNNDLDFKVSVSSLRDFYVEKFYALSVNQEKEDWKKFEGEELSFKELRPGKYSLSLIAKSNLNFKNNKGGATKVYFEILPYFWETTIFKILFFILCIFLFVLFLKLYQLRLYKKNKILLEHYNLELKALKAQMNPHFLFNTLNNMQSVIFLKDELFVNQYFTKFSRLLRNTLDIVNSDIITLYEELNYIKSYIDLEKVKFEDNFVFSMEIDENIKPSQIKIPVMLLQPFVENAIIHGLSGNPEKKELKIKVIHDVNDLERVYILIEDNGKGYVKIKKDNTDKHVSYGTSIIKNRIIILNKIYHTNFDFTIQNLSEIDQNLSGTRVVIKVPLQY